jgi:hypothetical protein
LFGKVGIKKSFHSRLSYDEINLRNSAMLPGPGEYKSTDRLPDIRKGGMSLTGASTPLMNTIQYTSNPVAGKLNPKG